MRSKEDNFTGMIREALGGRPADPMDEYRVTVDKLKAGARKLLEGIEELEKEMANKGRLVR